MLRRTGGYLTTQDPEKAPKASLELEQRGFTLLHDVLTREEINSLADDITRIYELYPRDNRTRGHRSAEADDMFRYEMLNRSSVCQTMVAHPEILAVIEPLLGNDCHVIANTAWKNPAGHPGSDRGEAWHIDAGPHIPLSEGTFWPAEIPHPVFAIAIHVYLQDCNLEAGPTGVIPGSHLSGRFPPRSRAFDMDLEYAEEKVTPLIARAGDVALFVSDVWHRRLPAGEGDTGRFFLQIHYGRRDIAQRLHSSLKTNQLSVEAVGRAGTEREKTVIGLHKPYFYDG